MPLKRLLLLADFNTGNWLLLPLPSNMQIVSHTDEHHQSKIDPPKKISVNGSELNIDKLDMDNGEEEEKDGRKILNIL